MLRIDPASFREYFRFPLSGHISKARENEASILGSYVNTHTKVQEMPFQCRYSHRCFCALSAPLLFMVDSLPTFITT